MAITKNRLKLVRDQGVEEDEILSLIQEEMPHLSEKITLLQKEGYSPFDISNVIAEQGTRGFFKDLAVQVPTRIQTGLTAMPRATLEAVEGIARLATSPQETLANMARGLVGIEPQELEKEPEILERVLGKESFEKLKDNLGITKLVDVGNFVIDNVIKKPFQAVKENLPDAKEAERRLQRDLGIEDIDLSPSTPATSVLAKGIESTTESLPFGLPVAVALGFGGASGQVARELGSPEFIAKDIDLAASILAMKPSVKKIASNKPMTKKQVTKLFDKDINKFISESKPFIIDDATGTTKLKPSKIQKKDIALLEPIDAITLSEEIASEAREPLFNKINPINRGREQSVKDISKKINERKVKDRGIVANEYVKVENLTHKKHYNVSEAQNAFVEMKKNLKENGFLGTGETELKKVLNDLKIDLFGKQKIVDKIPTVVKEPISTIKEAIRINKNLNDKLTFNITDPTKRSKAINIMKPFKKKLANSIDAHIRGLGKEELLSWRKAQSGHRAWVERYSKDSVIDFLFDKDFDKLAKSVTNKKNITDLKKALLEKDIATKSILDRLVVEELDLSKPTKDLRKTFRDLQTSLDPVAKEQAENIINLNDSRGFVKQTEAMSNIILDDINKASVSGELPARTLKMMHNQRGYELVKKTLSKTKNGKKALSVIEDTFVQSHIDNIFKNGAVDSKNLKTFLKNKEVLTVFEQINGKESVDLLKNLEKQNKQWEKAFKRRPLKVKDKVKDKVKKKTSFLEDPVEWANENKGKAGLSMMLLKSMGVPIKAVSIGTIGISEGTKLIGRAMKNKKITNILNKISTRPETNKILLININKELKEIKKELTE